MVKKQPTQVLYILSFSVLCIFFYVRNRMLNHSKAIIQPALINKEKKLQNF